VIHICFSISSMRGTQWCSLFLLLRNLVKSAKLTLTGSAPEESFSSPKRQMWWSKYVIWSSWWWKHDDEVHYALWTILGVNTRYIYATKNRSRPHTKRRRWHQSSQRSLQAHILRHQQRQAPPQRQQQEEKRPNHKKIHKGYKPKLLRASPTTPNTSL
jgi:hypothetical protein